MADAGGAPCPAARTWLQARTMTRRAPRHSMIQCSEATVFCCPFLRRTANLRKRFFQRFKKLPSNIGYLEDIGGVLRRESFTPPENIRRYFMADTNAVVAVFETHPGAEGAVKELEKAGFDMKKLSVVGKDYHTEEHVVGY